MNALQFLDHLNTTYARLHKDFEDAFWVSRMGDHGAFQDKIKFEAARDAFRSDPVLKAKTISYIKETNNEKTVKGKEIVGRLKLWLNFFNLFLTPPEAVPLREKVAQIEAKMQQYRASRKEGYIDPETKNFVEASENKMRIVMRTHSDEAVRKACFDALEQLPLGTLDDYIAVVGARNEFARTLGYADFYDYKIHIDEGMTKKELFAIFEKVYEKTKYAFKDIRAIEQKSKKDKPGLRKPWNFGYMMSGNFTKEEDPYFQFEDALGYWGRSFAALDVGLAGGTITLDLVDRKGKWNNGFCHYPGLVQYENKNGDKVRIPGTANFTSNAVPGQIGSGIQGLHTLFHEGGHAVDRLNSTQQDVCINTEYPPCSVSWAETHSIFMDSISGSIEWKTRYAKDASGNKYPFDIFERKLKATYPLMPLGMMHICRVVFFEKEIYEHKKLTREAVLSIAKKMGAKYSDLSEDSIALLNVPHIYSWDSSAYYHGYGLAEMAVHQWRDYFFKKYGYIVDNPNVGKELVKIWQYASLYPAKKLVKMATGKALGPETFIKNSTRSLAAILKNAREKIARLEKVPEFNKPVDLGGRVIMVHGTRVISDNSISFEDMEKKYRKWLKTLAK